MSVIITVIGTGYVGLTTAVFLSLSGYRVYALDIDNTKIETIKSGRSFFYEPFLDDFVKQAISSGNLIPTLDYREAVETTDVVFSCVGTPSNPDGSSNLTYIFDVVRKISVLKKAGKLIFVQKSTVPVGTGEKIYQEVKKLAPNLKLHYVSNPEFLSEGSAVYDTLFFDRLVLGTKSTFARKVLIEIFRNLHNYGKSLPNNEFGDYVNTYKTPIDSSLYSKKQYEDRIVDTNVESAELIKVTANAFLALKISFANSIAMLAEKSGANVVEVMDGIGRDARIGRSFLYAGLGWGGGCFPKDVSGLISTAKDYGLDIPIMQAAVDINARMVDFVVSKVRKLNLAKGAKVSVLGLSFKPGTSDIRMSQAIKLVNDIYNLGLYKISVYDPQVSVEVYETLNKNVVLELGINEAIKDSSCVIIATEWKEFREYDWLKNSDKLAELNLIDARNCITKDLVSIIKQKYNYQGVGIK